MQEWKKGIKKVLSYGLSIGSCNGTRELPELKFVTGVCRHLMGFFCYIPDSVRRDWTATIFKFFLSHATVLPLVTSKDQEQLISPSL